MHKSLTLRNALLFVTLLATVFTACSKSSGDFSENAVNNENGKIVTSRSHNNPSSFDGVDDKTFGSLYLTVSPADVVSKIIIFNDDFSSEDFQLIGSGEFQIDNVPTGIYTVLVVPNDDSYRKSQVTDVQITEAATTDIGNITLQN